MLISVDIRRGPVTMVLLSAMLLLASCNAVFGLDEPQLDDQTGVGGGGGATTLAGGGDGSQTAVSSSSAGLTASGGSGGMGGIGGAGGMGGDGGVGPVSITFGERSTTDVSGVTSDTHIRNDFPMLNSGQLPSIVVDGIVVPAQHSVGLLRFDVSAIPTGVAVLAAQLELWVDNTPASTSVGTMSLFALNEDWDEGNGASPGYANYNDRRSGVPWSGTGATGVSRNATPFASFTDTAQNTMHTVVLPAALVQMWVDNKTANFGMAIENSTADGVGLVSRNHSDVEKRPLLTVAYQLSP